MQIVITSDPQLLRLRRVRAVMTQDTVGDVHGLGVHLIPASIKFDGLAPVQKYFKVEDHRVQCTSIDSDNINQQSSGIKELRSNQLGDGICESTFRGRALYGAKIALPELYSGHVVEVTEKLTNGPSSNNLTDNQYADYESPVFKTDKPSSGQASDSSIIALRSISRFRTLSVWVPDDPVKIKDDPYAIAIRHFAQLADLVHG